MLLGEELVLLLLDDDKGTWLVRERAVRRSLRVALVVELLARRTVAFDDEGALVADLAGTTGGDPLLDRVAGQVTGKPLAVAIDPGRRELPEVLRRLRGRGTLRRGLVRRGRHLPQDHHPEAAVLQRLRSALGTEARPDRHTALLVALVYELGLLATLFPDQDRDRLTSRAASVTAQLREDAHYFPTTLDQDVRTRESLAGPEDVLDGVGTALEALDAVGNLGRLAGLTVRAVARLLEDLP